MTPEEKRVLRRLCREDDYYGFCFMSFSAINRSVRIGIKSVRRACRSLRRKGYAEFSSGLFTEDGAIAGSGYAATRAGRIALEGKQ